MTAAEVLIAGAGPTGLSMAIEMATQNIPFRLIDKSDHAARWSQALVVQARTLEQFERYGIAEKAVKQGRKLKAARGFSDGKEIACVDLDRIPGRFPFVLFLPQNDTESLLTEHLTTLGGAIERSVELLSFQNGNDSIEAQLRHADGRIEPVSTRWLIGCDGAHSKVRSESKVAFPGDTVGFSFFLADMKLEGDLPRDELRVYLHKGDVVFIGPLKPGVYRVIVALHDAADQKNALTWEDFQQPLNRVVGKGIRITGSEWMTPFHINQRKAEHYRIGNVFLAGDACHIHSPVAGQGMNTGIQDTANLAWKLAAVRNGADPKLLDSYDEERGAVGEALLKTTSRGLSAATLKNPIAEAIRDAVAKLAARIPAVQQAITAFVSETAINYRGSSIVFDGGGPGPLHAGDRMPDPVAWEDGKAAVIAYNPSHAEEIRRLTPRGSFSTVQDESGSRVLVIRPDGYIGFRGYENQLSHLDGYARATGLQ